eukprot:PhM_4_TR4516/c0_g1_i1/m.58664
MTTTWDQYTDEDTFPDFYKTLGISRNADQREIEKAYRRGALKAHPDKKVSAQHTLITTSTPEPTFHELSEAYHVLHTAESRQEYDAKYDEFAALRELKALTQNSSLYTNDICTTPIMTTTTTTTTNSTPSSMLETMVQAARARDSEQQQANEKWDNAFMFCRDGSVVRRRASAGSQRPTTGSVSGSSFTRTLPFSNASIGNGARPSSAFGVGESLGLEARRGVPATSQRSGSAMSSRPGSSTGRESMKPPLPTAARVRSATRSQSNNNNNNATPSPMEPTARPRGSAGPRGCPLPRPASNSHDNSKNSNSTNNNSSNGSSSLQSFFEVQNEKGTEEDDYDVLDLTNTNNNIITPPDLVRKMSFPGGRSRDSNTLIGSSGRPTGLAPLLLGKSNNSNIKVPIFGGGHPARVIAQQRQQQQQQRLSASSRICRGLPLRRNNNNNNNSSRRSVLVQQQQQQEVYQQYDEFFS